MASPVQRGAPSLRPLRRAGSTNSFSAGLKFLTDRDSKFPPLQTGEGWGTRVWSNQNLDGRGGPPLPGFFFLYDFSSRWRCFSVPDLYNPVKRTIGDLLSTTSPRIVVSDYQRDFSWTESEADVFFRDLIAFSNRYPDKNVDTQEYFLGSCLSLAGQTISCWTVSSDLPLPLFCCPSFVTT